MSRNNRPPHRTFGRLNLEMLEAREVPAVYAVGLLSPAAGDAGDSAATFTGGITLEPPCPPRTAAPSSPPPARPPPSPPPW